ncbi:RES family NAD+ phosphorylase [Marinilabilia rubra]|uniref:RES domain-containing protein n=1 Tax=Marinilabilia rubra TaxID=2162893 RepID=A0A2U2B4N2_9BACT|nr:RES family NAD+ phosphorylase [Marinilabilia rubra]PWD97994.1 hypothetical protein DDZ16_18150 [Marinilabilia rubra]
MAYSLEVYRICKTEYAGDLKGTGAYKVGGRWNTPGNYMLYTSSSVSLSMLEVLVNFSPSTFPEGMSLVIISIPTDSISELSIENLNDKWASLPIDYFSQSVGDAWLESKESLTLTVPSVINPREINYLVNPLHPDFNKVHIKEILPWNFDSRLMWPPLAPPKEGDW